jgi:hypothetical protein
LNCVKGYFSYELSFDYAKNAPLRTGVSGYKKHSIIPPMIEC